jgi:hypothetical protein
LGFNRAAAALVPSGGHRVDELLALLHLPLNSPAPADELGEDRRPMLTSSSKTHAVVSHADDVPSFKRSPAKELDDLNTYRHHTTFDT